MDLSDALDQFERTFVNIGSLKDLWQQYEKHIPDEANFGLDTPHINQIRRRFADIVKSLPAIDGESLEVELLALDEISQMIVDAAEIGYPESYRDIVDQVQLPRNQLENYEDRLIKTRRKLARNRIDKVIAIVDNLLRSTISVQGGLKFSDDSEGWSGLQDMISELDRLLESGSLTDTRLSDLHRHLHYREPCDLSDIVNQDWPSVRAALIGLVFDGEPLAVSVDDLGELVRSQPTGSVTSKLPWEKLDSETFERLIFDLLRTADGYENTGWLMKTNAPDRGRDLSAERVMKDELSGTKRVHTLIQCKHWVNRSINVSDISALLAKTELWNRKFAVVIIVTSGRFTQDSVNWQESRESKGEFPAVEFWSGSHLEHLIASRPYIRLNYFES